MKIFINLFDQHKSIVGLRIFTQYL